MPARERAYYKGEKTKELSIIGVSENFAAVNFLKLAAGRFFTESEVQHRRARRRARRHARAGALPERRPDRQDDPRRRGARTRSSASCGKRPSPFGATAARTTSWSSRTRPSQKQFGWRRTRPDQHQRRGDRRQRHAERDDRRRAAEGATREEAHARSRADHADPARPEARPGRTTSTSSRRTPSSRCGTRSPAPSSSAWSSSRRSR